MYDWPQVEDSTDRLWASVRDALRGRKVPAPDAIDRQTGLWDLWESPDLVFGQTCGMPFRTKLHDRVALIGTPDFGLPDAPPGHYYSVFVIRKDDAGTVADFIDRTLAFNGQDSQSGWAAPQNHVAAMGLPAFVHTRHTGAHRLSALAVVERRADIAAIDAVTWRFITAHEPEVACALRVIDHTAPTPGLPYIASPALDRAAIAEAALEGIDSLDRAAKDALGLRGMVQIPLGDYLKVPTPPPPSQDAPPAWAK
jgi:ABC-type phosphate/phosphonate transport system substrate-binding protein